MDHLEAERVINDISTELHLTGWAMCILDLWVQVIYKIQEKAPGGLDSFKKNMELTEMARDHMKHSVIRAWEYEKLFKSEKADLDLFLSNPEHRQRIEDKLCHLMVAKLVQSIRRAEDSASAIDTNRTSSSRASWSDDSAVVPDLLPTSQHARVTPSFQHMGSPIGDRIKHAESTKRPRDDAAARSAKQSKRMKITAGASEGHEDVVASVDAPHRSTPDAAPPSQNPDQDHNIIPRDREAPSYSPMSIYDTTPRPDQGPQNDLRKSTDADQVRGDDAGADAVSSVDLGWVSEVSNTQPNRTSPVAEDATDESAPSTRPDSIAAQRFTTTARQELSTDSSIPPPFRFGVRFVLDETGHSHFRKLDVTMSYDDVRALLYQGFRRYMDEGAIIALHLRLSVMQLGNNTNHIVCDSDGWEHFLSRLKASETEWDCVCELD